MTIQDFITEGKQALREYFDETGQSYQEIRDAEVVKTNDTRLHGIIIASDDGVGINVYIDDIFLRYENGLSWEEARNELVARCADALAAECPPVSPEMDFDLESIRSRLSVKLLDVKNNMSYMAERPYIDVGCGLALVAVINWEEAVTSDWVIGVNDSVLEKIGCDRTTLLTAALENTMRLEPPVMTSLEEWGKSSDPFEVQQDNILDTGEMPDKLETGACVLTNRSKWLGAAVLFYPGVVQRIADILRGSYYIIPSSIHEVILLPESESADPSYLKNVLIHANENFVKKEEILSDSIFVYDRDADHIRMAS